VTEVPPLTRFKGFDDLPTLEQVDFIAACFKLGVSACDFEFSMIEHFSHANPAPTRRLALIALRDCAFTQSYVADAGVEWISLFIFDFANGVLGTSQEQDVYDWRRKFGAMEPADVKRLRALEAENDKLKKLLAERDLEIDMMKEINHRK